MIKLAKVAHIKDIAENTLNSFEIDGEPVVIVKMKDQFHAFYDVCSHMEYPLSDGSLTGEIVTCAYHGAKFNIKTGEVLSMPAMISIRILPVKIIDEYIYVEL